MEVLASDGVLGVLSSVFHWDILSRGVGGGASNFSWNSMSWVTKAPAPRIPPQHFLSVYFFSIDPQHFVDGSTSSPGYSVIGENPGLFKFWSLSRSVQIITSIPQSKSTLATFQLMPPAFSFIPRTP